MKTIELKIEVECYSGIDELITEDKELIHLAKESAESAYSPYSRFSVGAAALLDNGKIVTGSNQENAAYPSGLCAERVALFYANSQYPDTPVKSLAICAKNKNGFIQTPVPPCGSCRQVISETTERFGKPIKLVLYGEQEIQIIKNSNELLPIHFKKSSLI